MGDDEPYYPGDSVEVHVDGSDVTHLIAVRSIQENVVSGVIGIVIAAAFTLGWVGDEIKPANLTVPGVYY